MSLLLRFQDRTYVFHTTLTKENDLTVNDRRKAIEFASRKTGWPVDCLAIDRWTLPFVSLKAKSFIRGGKGGFGTLLKGQARQAGANVTTDFGACRDLQGRRLRPVNQAIDQEIRKEWQEKVDAGTATKEEMAKALAKTDSGVAGWHLQLPSWAEVSGKKQQRLELRKIRRWKRERDAEEAAKSEKKRRREEMSQMYVDQAKESSMNVSSAVMNALQQGLSTKKSSELSTTPPECIISVSGEVVIDGSDSPWRIQSKSNFATFVIILDYKSLKNPEATIFYEVKVVSSGVMQLGWAAAPFRPSSDSGDGVGDCARSWAYDGSRGIMLHDGVEHSCSGNWKTGDVVRCHYSPGQVSWTVNGESAGELLLDMEGPEATGRLALMPAFSLNNSEQMEARINRDWKISDMLWEPSDDCDDIEFLNREPVDAPSSNKETSLTHDSSSSPEQVKTDHDDYQPLDLEKYSAVSELEALGLDRLKGSLKAIGCKCGGSLSERAQRLFCLKGLSPEQFPKKVLARKS